MQGVLYFLPYTFFGLFAGEVTGSFNRKIALGVILLLASASMGVSGVFDSLALFILMRVIHGILNSMTNPLAVSLVADYFPPESRTSANSIVNAAFYAGEGIASLSIHLISVCGWRMTYVFSGMISLVFGLMTLLFIIEPPRGKFVEVLHVESVLIDD